MKKLIVLLLVVCLASLAGAASQHPVSGTILYQNDFGTAAQVTVGGIGDWDAQVSSDGTQISWASDSYSGTDPYNSSGVAGVPLTLDDEGGWQAYISDHDGDGLYGFLTEGASVLGTTGNGQWALEKGFVAPAGYQYENIVVVVEGIAGAAYGGWNSYARAQLRTSALDTGSGEYWNNTAADYEIYIAEWADGDISLDGHDLAMTANGLAGGKASTPAEAGVPNILVAGALTEFYLTIGTTLGSDSTATYKKSRINSVTVYGDLVLIPEPATMVLLSLGGLLIRRKRA